MSKKEEVMRRCLVCGKVYCYSPVVADSVKTAKIVGISNFLFWLTRKDSFNTNITPMTTTAMTTNWANALSALEQIKCPNCGSLKSEPFNGDAYTDDVASGMPGEAQVSINPNATEESLIERIEDFIEDKEWAKASGYCEHVLDMSPHNGYAYLLRCMVLHKVSSEDELVKIKDFLQDSNIKKAFKYADGVLRDRLTRLTNLANQYQAELEQEVIFLEENAKYSKDKGELILTRKKLEFCGNKNSFIFELSKMSDISARENYNYIGVKLGRTLPNCIFFYYEHQKQWIFCKSGSARQLATLINEQLLN